tara:strand:- start:323 stop:574 length:252 start_codon:yes stop_codon:yes gene_type:complete
MEILFIEDDFTLRNIWPLILDIISFIWNVISYFFVTLWKLLTFQASWLDTNFFIVIVAACIYFVLIYIIYIFIYFTFFDEEKK